MYRFTRKNLNSKTVKDSQGLVRSCQVLDQPLHLPLSTLPVLGILEIRCQGLEHGELETGSVLISMS